MKVYGKKDTYIPLRQDASRLVISYEINPLDDGIHATWFEVYLYKKQKPSITFDDVKSAILDDINAQTNENILSGFVWNDIPVWLSSEHQFDYKAAYDLAHQTNGANLPIKFKLGEDDEANPVYYTFEDMVTFTDFYTKTIAYINQCLNEGWARKDSIDWNDYSVYFPVINE